MNTALIFCFFLIKQKEGKDFFTDAVTLARMDRELLTHYLSYQNVILH